MRSITVSTIEPSTSGGNIPKKTMKYFYGSNSEESVLDWQMAVWGRNLTIALHKLRVRYGEMIFDFGGGLITIYHRPGLVPGF